MPASIKHLTEPGSKFVSCLLAKWSDGLHYKGEVMECDVEARRCLVKFEDNSQHWMSADELHADLDPKYIHTDQIVCCVCDADNSEPPNEIILCDQCQQGYHIECHKPSINREKCKVGDDEAEWNCSTCIEVLNPKSQSSSKASSQRSSTTPKRRKARKSMASTVPKVKLDKKKNSEPVKKVIKLEEKSDVEFVARVESQKPPIVEDIPKLIKGQGAEENVHPSLVRAAKNILDHDGVLTEEVVSNIVKEETNGKEEKSPESEPETDKKKKTVIRKNRKPVAPAS